MFKLYRIVGDILILDLYVMYHAVSVCYSEIQRKLSNFQLKFVLENDFVEISCDGFVVYFVLTLSGCP
jgi:hypothetical protein